VFAIVALAFLTRGFALEAGRPATAHGGEAAARRLSGTIAAKVLTPELNIWHKKTLQFADDASGGKVESH